MCTSPILIRNKKYRSLDVKIPNSFVHVPCGVCDECLRKRAKDLFVRAKYETEQTFLSGGCGFMCTLTYDNDHLPILNHLGKNYLVFNKKHVIDFLKRLRTNLDRLYMKHYNKLAPDFKYLVTSEFGTDPTRTHRPHYHAIFLFSENIGLFCFRRAFVQSLVNRRDGRRVFGRIYQCDPLDIKQGGVSYVCKYILKDQTYNKQNQIINEKIKFWTHFVSSKYGINEFPETSDDFFKNKCIRSNREYRKDIDAFVKPFRHMLQFYMCSNDFGCSAIFKRYGENLYSLGLLNIDGFPYSIPKQVIQRLERDEGSDKKDIITKTIFQNQFDKCANDCQLRGLITQTEATSLREFVSSFIQPRFGSLYFISPSGVCNWNRISDFKIKDFDSLFEEFNFYDANNFFDMRNKVLHVINLSNCQENLEFRRKLAFRKTQREREDYEKKKRNKPSNY